MFEREKIPLERRPAIVAHPNLSSEVRSSVDQVFDFFPRNQKMVTLLGKIGNNLQLAIDKLRLVVGLSEHYLLAMIRILNTQDRQRGFQDLYIICPQRSRKYQFALTMNNIALTTGKVGDLLA